MILDQCQDEEFITYMLLIKIMGLPVFPTIVLGVEQTARTYNLTKHPSTRHTLALICEKSLTVILSQAEVITYYHHISLKVQELTGPKSDNPHYGIIKLARKILKNVYNLCLKC